MRNLKILTKLKLLGLLVSILLLAAFMVNYREMTHIASDLTIFIEREQARVLLINEMYAQALQSEQATRNIVLKPGDATAANNYRKSLEEFDASYKKVESLAAERGESSPDLPALLRLWQETNTLKEKVQVLALEGKREEAVEFLVRMETPKWRECKQTLLALKTAADRRMRQQHADISRMVKSAATIALSIFLVVILCVVAALGMVSRDIGKRIRGFRETMDEITSGTLDLTVRFDQRRNDELGEIATSLNGLLSRLHEIIIRVMDDAVKVTAASIHIQENSRLMIMAASEASERTEGVATAGEEMSATAGDIASNCHAAATNSQKSTELARFGADVVRESVEIMNRIAGRVTLTATTIGELGEQSNRIGDIVGTIEDIADQTNLLALNAAIEAAHAGEQGRGFAVVADEVRALADRTTNATREIGEMIKTIQTKTRDAVEMMEQGVSEVRRGTKESTRSGEALNGILEQINCVETQVSQIATAAEEQTATTAEISGNIHHISAVIRKTSDDATASAREANQLTVLAEALQGEIRNFKTRESALAILDIARNDHQLFFNRIKSAVQGTISLNADEVADHHQCRFGKWYDSDGKNVCGHLRSFRAIDAPHEQFHRLSREAVQAAHDGDCGRAEKNLEQVDALSRQVIDLLGVLKTETR